MPERSGWVHNTMMSLNWYWEYFMRSSMTVIYTLSHVSSWTTRTKSRTCSNDDIYSEIQVDRQTNRQTDRQTDRQYPESNKEAGHAYHIYTFLSTHCMYILICSGLGSSWNTDLKHSRKSFSSNTDTSVKTNVLVKSIHTIPSGSKMAFWTRASPWMTPHMRRSQSAANRACFCSTYSQSTHLVHHVRSNTLSAAPHSMHSTSVTQHHL